MSKVVFFKFYRVPLEEQEEDNHDDGDINNEFNETPVRLLRLSQARRAELINRFV